MRGPACRPSWAAGLSTKLINKFQNEITIQAKSIYRYQKQFD
jgi:hypothetical protein